MGMFVGLLSALITIALFAGLSGTSGFGLIEAPACGCCSLRMLGGAVEQNHSDDGRQS
jgi:hypothetical protein